MTLKRFVIERDVPGVGLNDDAGFWRRIAGRRPG